MKEPNDVLIDAGERKHQIPRADQRVEADRKAGAGSVRGGSGYGGSGDRKPHH
jgi:hypothetical protein